MTKSKNIIFHINEKNSHNVANIECDSSFDKIIKSAASNLYQNSSPKQLGIISNILRNSIAYEKRKLMIKSGCDVQEVDFDTSLPLFADYFAKLNIKHEQEADEIARKLVEQEEIEIKHKTSNKKSNKRWQNKINQERKESNISDSLDGRESFFDIKPLKKPDYRACDEFDSRGVNLYW